MQLFSPISLMLLIIKANMLKRIIIHISYARIARTVNFVWFTWYVVMLNFRLGGLYWSVQLQIQQFPRHCLAVFTIILFIWNLNRYIKTCRNKFSSTLCYCCVNVDNKNEANCSSDVFFIARKWIQRSFLRYLVIL